MREVKSPVDLVFVDQVKHLSVYGLYINETLAFQVVIDETDPELHIIIVGTTLGGNQVVMPTAGRAQWTLSSRKVGPDEADVEVYERIASTPIRTYLAQALPFILFELYRGELPADVSECINKPGHLHGSTVKMIEELKVS